MAEFTSDIFSLISKVSSEQDLDLTKDLDRASFVQKMIKLQSMDLELKNYSDTL